MKQSGQAGFKRSPMSEVGTDLKIVKCEMRTTLCLQCHQTLLIGERVVCVCQAVRAQAAVGCCVVAEAVCAG